MNKVCTLYYKACLKYGLNPVINDNMGGFLVTLGDRVYAFRASHTPFNDPGSATISSNKYCTNQMLKEAGIPVTQADAIIRDQPQANIEALASLQFPLVLKPTWDTSCGEDVICNIKDHKTLNTLIDDLFTRHDCISVEEFQGGLRSFRVLVLFNKVIAVAERVPAHVIGDGVHTIQELIDIQNLKREEFKHILPLGNIKIMLETTFIFKELGLTENDVPKLNEKIPLRYICNSTFGGSIIGLDVKTICKENADMILKAAKKLNLDFVGFDFICTDISIPYSQSRGYVIEANSSPDISIHETVVQGVSTIVSEQVIKKFIYKHLFAYLWYRANRGLPSLILRFLLVLAIAMTGYLFYVSH